MKKITITLFAGALMLLPQIVLGAKRVKQKAYQKFYWFPSSRNNLDRVEVEQLEKFFDVKKENRMKVAGTWVEKSYQKIHGAKLKNAWIRNIKNQKGRTLHSQGRVFKNLPTQFEDKIVRAVARMRASQRGFLIESLKAKHPIVRNASYLFKPEVEVMEDPVTKKLEPGWVLALISSDEASAFRLIFNSKKVLIKQEEVQSEFSGEAHIFPEGPKLSDLTRVPLPEMIGEGELSNSLITVFSALQTKAFSENHVYQYETSDSRFDEVQVYFFVDRAIRWFKTELETELPSRLDIKTHVGKIGGSNAALYFRNKIFLGTGDGLKYKNLLWDPTVVIHETAHAYIDHIAHLPPRGEGGAMNEGFADFFTACLLDHPLMGEVSYIPKAYRRSIENNLRAYEDFNTSIYHNSTIISGTLWEIKEKLGSKKTALLALHTLSRLGEDSKFEQFPSAMLSASTEHSSEDDRAYIIQILRDRGWLK